MNNGYQPKKKGDGTPPAPPTSGSNIQTPKTVYIVTSGAYSDYSIEAVFDDRNKAKDFVALQLAKRRCPDVYQPEDYFEIETYEIQDAVKIPDSMKLIYYFYSYKPSKHFAVLDKYHIGGPIAMLKRDYKPDADRIECVLDDDDVEKAVKILSEKFYIEKARMEGVSI